MTSLVEAREQAFENRKVARKGGDPRVPHDVPTFAQAAEAKHEELKPTWKNKQHSKSWLQTLEKYAYPVLADMPVDRIRPVHVLAVLKPIWTTRPETARRVRQRIRTVLASCEAREFVDRNVAGDLIEGALNRQRDKPKHHRSLPYVDVAQFVRELESWPASLSTKLCLIFTILTGTRGIEAREARFDEIDCEQRMWRIPGARMKMGEDHNQPLSEAALEVLDRARPLDDGSGYIFPSARKRGHPLTNTACMMIIRRMGYADRATVHGFRATFRTWASDCTRATERVKKLSTAHKPGDKMDAAYDRSFVLDPRRELMQRWGCHVMDRPYSGPELLDLSSSGLSLQELIDFLAPALSGD